VGEPVGGELGQSEPRSVPPSAVGQSPDVVGVTPAGTSPHKPGLLHTSIHVRPVRAPNSDGRVPTSWLELNPIFCRLVRAPNSEGTVPVSWLKYKNMLLRLVRAPNSEGTVPFNWLR